MKKLIASLLLLTTTPAWAGLPPTSVQGQSDASAQTKFNFQVPYNQKTDLGGIKALFETGNKNLLANPSFEHTSAFTSWSVTKDSGTTFGTAVETTIVADGKQSARVTATAAYGHVDQSVTPSIYTASQNMEASCKVYATSGTGLPQICALTGGSEAVCTSVAASSTWQFATVNFVGPANGTSVGVRFKTTVSDSTSYYLDDCYVGPARNTATLNQAQYFGGVTWVGTASCDWSVTANQSWSSYSANASCTTPTGANLRGAASAPGSKIPALTFSSMPPGDYYISVNGGFYNPTATVGCAYRITDGTNNTGPSYDYSGSGLVTHNIMGHLTYTTAQSNVTLQIQSTGATGSNTCHVETTRATYEDLTIDVYYFPSQSQTAYRPDVTPASWSGYQNGIAGGCSTSSATFADPSACTSIATTTLASRNITCSQTGSSLPGIDCVLPRAGMYQVCAEVALSANGNVGVSARLANGSGTAITPGILTTVTASGAAFINTQCATYSVTAAGSNTFKVQVATTSGTANIPQFGPSGAAAIQWHIAELDAPMPAPYLTGSVTTNGQGAVHTNWAKVGTGACTSSPCTIAWQTGSWLSSITRISQGKYRLNIASGEFSQIPSCHIQANVYGVADVFVSGPTSTQAPSTTSYDFNVDDAAGAVQDAAFDIECGGPR